MQEDEEQWISGEELNTEGESDEEGGGEGKGGKFKTKRRDRTLNHRSHLQMKSKLAASCGYFSPSKGVCPPSPPPALMPPTVSISHDPGNAYAEAEPASISWKPKRGSIKLPNIDLEALGKLRCSDVLHNSTPLSDNTTSTTTTSLDTTLDTTTQDLDQGPATSSDLPD